jgi:hypothetical protein
MVCYASFCSLALRRCIAIELNARPRSIETVRSSYLSKNTLSRSIQSVHVENHLRRRRSSEAFARTLLSRIDVDSLGTKVPTNETRETTVSTSLNGRKSKNFLRPTTGTGTQT